MSRRAKVFEAIVFLVVILTLAILMNVFFAYRDLRSERLHPEAVNGEVIR